MTVKSYLDFVARIKGVPGTQRRTQVDDVMQKCSIGDVRNRIIGKLSKGYKQRVGLAQSLLNNPEVLVLDEPTIGLDPKQIFEVRSLIKGLAGEHTVILSTHILPEVSMTCHRVIIINDGKVIAMDTPEGLAHQVKGADRVALLVDGPEDAVKEQLSSVAGVLGVQVTSTGNGKPASYTVECKVDHDVRRDLAAAIVSRGWGLLELRGVSVSLEDVFINLTTKE
jgi:ABC-2 type transport system ATP-binding protein